MSGFWKDVRFAFRQLRARPGFTAIGVLVLALGLGANAAIFSVVNAVLLQPLPYPHPETLVSVFESYVVGDGEDARFNSVSPGLLQQWQTDARSALSAVRFTQFNVTSKNRSFNPQRIIGIACSSTYGGILGLRPILGRFFTESETSSKLLLLRSSHISFGTRITAVQRMFFPSRFGSTETAMPLWVSCRRSLFIKVSQRSSSLLGARSMATIKLPTATTSSR